MVFSSDNTSLQNQLPLSVELSDDPQELRYDINDLYQTIASAVNNKIGGLYVPQEKINSQQYFNSANVQQYKSVYRMVVDFGALPNAGTKSVAHNIPGWTSSFRLTCAYGASTDPSALEAVPIPNEGIFLKINDTYAIVTTSSNFSAFTDTTIVIEYTKAS
jgi:hypothetical protein